MNQKTFLAQELLFSIYDHEILVKNQNLTHHNISEYLELRTFPLNYLLPNFSQNNQ
ncbi:MAG: hypothetical protein F6K23_17120 [Okeania sp. SIO2C9]|uniref:hypothetical protein n=1 Tax=Okeania sp. SIO2C9 TaxID=2607791 RepID=UPI0013C010F5|nr:hypothetical protein [Okeania sp. SIO2C9]NEQ74609.1 hypothetical protein [Okeania sp. SIO2C9]